MLIATRKNFFSKSYRLYDQQQLLTELSIHSLREKASFSVRDRNIEIRKPSLVKSEFNLTLNGQALARASKLSVWKYDTLIQVSDQNFLLKRKHWFTRETEAYYSGRRIGSVKPGNLWNNKIEVDIPESIPIEIRIFMLIICLFYWNRDANAGGV